RRKERSYFVAIFRIRIAECRNKHFVFDFDAIAIRGERGNERSKKRNPIAGGDCDAVQGEKRSKITRMAHPTIWTLTFDRMLLLNQKSSAVALPQPHHRPQSQ